MGKRLAVGSKKPNKFSKQTTSDRLQPLPKMYQMGIMAGAKAERERIIALLEALDTEQWCGTNLQIVALIKGENE